MTGRAGSMTPLTYGSRVRSVYRARWTGYVACPLGADRFEVRAQRDQHGNPLRKSFRRVMGRRNLRLLCARTDCWTEIPDEDWHRSFSGAVLCHEHREERRPDPMLRLESGLFVFCKGVY